MVVSCWRPWIKNVCAFSSSEAKLERGRSPRTVVKGKLRHRLKSYFSHRERQTVIMHHNDTEGRNRDLK